MTQIEQDTFEMQVRAANIGKYKSFLIKISTHNEPPKLLFIVI